MYSTQQTTSFLLLQWPVQSAASLFHGSMATLQVFHDNLDPILISCRSSQRRRCTVLDIPSRATVLHPPLAVGSLDHRSRAFVDASDILPLATSWVKLFERLGRESIDLQTLYIYLDHLFPASQGGLGRDLRLTSLNVERTITIGAFYAQPLD